MIWVSYIFSGFEGRKNLFFIIEISFYSQFLHQEGLQPFPKNDLVRGSPHQQSPTPRPLLELRMLWMQQKLVL